MRLSVFRYPLLLNTDSYLLPTNSFVLAFYFLICRSLNIFWMLFHCHFLFQISFCCWLSVQCSRSVAWDSLRPHEPQHARPPCPSPTPRVYPNSCPLHWWCHPTISSSMTLFSFCLQSFPASGYFPMSQLFTSGSQSIGASASVLPMNIQGWFPVRLTVLTPSLSKGHSRVLSSTTVQKHQFFGS